MTPERLRLSVIIAAYNEATTIESVVERVRAVPLDTEIVAVDDGSSDGTGATGRTYSEGKKIGWRDGAAALWHILRFNLFPPT